MTPLYFGTALAPLYGVYHPPMGRDRNAGVVLCYPFGQEYMRSHRAFRQLALMLNRQGYHVLRFDYRGTGDSHANLRGVEFQAWIDDVLSAVEELRDSTGVASVSLLGLRLGALAAASAATRLDGLDRLVLWDPVLSGEAYEAELLEQVRRRAAAPGADPEVLTGTAVAADGSLFFNGFALPPSMRESLRGVRLLDCLPPAARRSLLVVSHESPEFEQIHRAADGPSFSYCHAPAPHDWNFVDNFGSILLPQPVLQAAVDWME